MAYWWVPDEKEVWILGKQEGDIQPNGCIKLLLSSGKHSVQQPSVCMQTVNAGNDEAPDDLISLPEVNQASILSCIRQRFREKKIYTSVGTVLMTVNPFERIKGLYGPEMIQMYATPFSEKGPLAPHVYLVPSRAFADMCRAGRNQSILISGESGAGKTEATKGCLAFLTAVSESSGPSSSSSSSSKVDIAGRIIAASPVLEAFGNAKTIRNPNSSRFGKWMELNFNQYNGLEGSTIISYLLEKSRVTRRDPEERNYHIFYQLLRGIEAGKLSEWYLTRDTSKYRYLERPGLGEAPDLDDNACFRETKDAFTEMGFEESETSTILRLVSAILHLGNIDFIDLNGGEASSVRPKCEHVTHTAKLLSVGEATLGSALTHKTTISPTIRRSIICMDLTPQVAIDTRDSLARAIYDKLFVYIIHSINSKASCDPSRIENGRKIGLLDIFGFEIFPLNSLEQLCINYCNEMLQNHFNFVIFTAEKALYSAEGIVCDTIEFKDNLPIIQDIEKLFKALDEEAKVPKGSSKTWYEKLKKAGATNKASMVLYPTRKDIFTVQHYAGNVDYLPFGFMEKNTEKLNEDLIDCMIASSDQLLQQLFQRSNDEEGGEESKSPAGKPAAGGGAAKKPQRSIAWKFQSQLTSLMTMLRLTESHFIRCIKSNDACKPLIFDAQLVHRQLLYSGVFEVVKIQQSGLPCRATHREFLDRFKPLAPSSIRYTLQNSHELVQLMKVPPYNFDLPQMQSGVTMVFFKGMEQRLIEAELAKLYRKSAVRIQAFERCHFRRRLYNGMFDWLTLLHSHAHAINASGAKSALVEVRKFVLEFQKISGYLILSRTLNQHESLVDLVEKREKLLNLATKLVATGDESSLQAMAPIPAQAASLSIMHLPIIMECCQMESAYRQAIKFIAKSGSEKDLAEMTMTDILAGINAVKAFESILAAAPSTLARANKWKNEVEEELEFVFKPLLKNFERAAVVFNSTNARMTQINGMEADKVMRSFLESLNSQKFKCKDTKNAYEDTLIFLRLCDEALVKGSGDQALRIVNSHQANFPVTQTQMDQFLQWANVVSCAQRLQEDLVDGGVKASATGHEPPVITTGLESYLEPLRLLLSPPESLAAVIKVAEVILKLRIHYKAKEWKQLEDFTFAVEEMMANGLFTGQETSAEEFENCIWITSYHNALADLLFVCKDPCFQLLPTTASDWSPLVHNIDQAKLALESASTFSSPTASPALEELIPLAKTLVDLRESMASMNHGQSTACINTLLGPALLAVARKHNFEDLIIAEMKACRLLIALVDGEDSLNIAILKGPVQLYKLPVSMQVGVGLSPTAQELNVPGDVVELKAAINTISSLIPDNFLPETLARLMIIARKILLGREVIAKEESDRTVFWDDIAREVNEISSTLSLDPEDVLIQTEVDNIVFECTRRSILKQLREVLEVKCVNGSRCVDLKVDTAELRDCENYLSTCIKRLDDFPNAPANLIHLSKFVVGIVNMRRALQKGVWTELYDSLTTLQSLLDDDGLASQGIVEEIELVRSEYIGQMEIVEMKEALVDLLPIIADDVSKEDKQALVDRISDGMYLMTRLPGVLAEQLLELGALVRLLCIKIIEGTTISIPEEKALEACKKYGQLLLSHEEIHKIYKYIRLRQSLKTICDAMLRNPTSETILETLDEIKADMVIPQEMVPWLHCAEAYGQVLQAMECRDWLTIVNRCRFLEEILLPLGSRPAFDPENEHKMIELAALRYREGYKLALEIKAMEAELQVTASVENVSLSELMKRTLRDEDATNPAGVSVLRRNGLSDKDIADKNIPLNVLWAMDIPAAILLAKGLSVLKMRAAGYTCVELLQGGYSVDALGKAGFDGVTLRKSGATIAQLKEAGFSDAKILTAGYPILQLKEAGFDATKLAKLGSSAVDLVTAGFTGQELRVAGFDALQLRGAGMDRVPYLRAAGFDLFSLVAAGFDTVELRDGGYDFESLREVGISDIKLLGAGFEEEISREVLLELFEATEGAHWKIKMNWGTNRPLKEWYGVTTELGQHEHGRYIEVVVGLDLHDNNLCGEIPRRLSMLIHLRALSLSMNNLHGVVPSGLSLMKSLSYVDLSNNPLLRELDPNGKRKAPKSPSENTRSPSAKAPPSRPKGVGAGAVSLMGIGTQQGRSPFSPGRNSTPLTREEKLQDQLASPDRDDSKYGRTEQSVLIELFNATEGAMWKLKRNWCTPSPLSQWYGLAVTRLDRVIRISLPMNNLQGVIPASIDCLVNLKELDLRYNQLCGALPSTIGNLTKLTQLHLHCNRLSGTIPDSITALTKLEVLDLRSNQLTGLLPINLHQMTSLSYLAATSNLIKVPSKQAVRSKIPWCRIVIL